MQGALALGSGELSAGQPGSRWMYLVYSVRVPVLLCRVTLRSAACSIIPFVAPDNQSRAAASTEHQPQGRRTSTVRAAARLCFATATASDCWVMPGLAGSIPAAAARCQAPLAAIGGTEHGEPRTNGAQPDADGSRRAAACERSGVFVPFRDAVSFESGRVDGNGSLEDGQKTGRRERS